jgi:hypothetical protein
MIRMSKSDAAIEPPAEQAAPKAPSLRSEVLKWALIAGLVGIVSGALEGLLIASKLGAGQTAIALDRTLVFGLFGAVLGALAGAVEWKLKVKRGRKA